MRMRADLPDLVELPEPECDEFVDPFELRRARGLELECLEEEERFDDRLERGLCFEFQFVLAQWFERELLSGDTAEKKEEYVDCVSSLPRGVLLLLPNITARSSVVCVTQRCGSITKTCELLGVS